MTREQAKQLREPFKPEQIGKLPKPTKKDNPRGKCSECGGYHGLPAVHLDYVGHAATTDRLLAVDPAWSWEPMAYGPNGEPLFTNGGLWIWLTVCGTKRPGFGDGASPKEIIGDAIRNAAMRFGVALDLWAKEDLNGGEEPPKPATDKERKPLIALLVELGDLEPTKDWPVIANKSAKSKFGVELEHLTREQVEALTVDIRAYLDEKKKEAA